MNNKQHYMPPEIQEPITLCGSLFVYCDIHYKAIILFFPK